MTHSRKVTRLAANIYWLRRYKLTITQQELADLIGSSKSLVCHWERGTRRASPTFLKKLSLAFDVTIDSLLRDDISGAFTHGDRDEI
jgi:transcriptional regulator with XRE-family HTH domain